MVNLTPQQLQSIFHYSIVAGVVPLVFIAIGFFFLADENENLGRAAWGRGRQYSMMLAFSTQMGWKYKAIMSPLALGLLFFGLVGMGCLKKKYDPDKSLLIAAGFGITVTLVLFCMASLLSQSASASPRRGRPHVGQTGVVVETIPARGSGTGSVEVRFGDVCQTFQAVSIGDPIPPDMDVTVVSLLSPEVVEVSATQVYTPLSSMQNRPAEPSNEDA